MPGFEKVKRKMLNFQNLFSVFHITAPAMTSKDGRRGNMACWGLWNCGTPSLSIPPGSAFKGNL